MIYEDGDGQRWFSEYVNPSDRMHIRVRRVLADRVTAFQTMQIIDTEALGRALVLDGSIQSSTVDEFIYHESLVHPAMLTYGLEAGHSPRSVLILGGGEGATAREVLRWRGVERVVMVDIDGEVIGACREHMPSMHAGAFDDPRCEVVVGDALALLDHTEERWDIVLSDLCDPVEHGPAFQLFTREYISRVQRVMTPAGVFAMQAGAASIVDHAIHARLVNTVGQVFPSVEPYGECIPCFGTPWGFLVGSVAKIDRCPDPAAADALIAAQIEGELRLIDGARLGAQRQLPPFLRKRIEDETGVYTADDPPRYSGGQGKL